MILLRQLVITDFKLRYQGSVLGYLWSLLRPAALFIILYIVFGKVIRVGEGIPNYSIYLLLGIVLWNFFVEVTSGSVTSIVSKGDLLRKLSFPRYVVVLSGSVSALINLFLNLLVVLVFSVFKGVDFSAESLFVFPLLAELYVFSLSVAFLLSALYVKLRDMSFVWEVFVQAAFYATPIIYPLSLVVNESQTIAKFMILNPVAQVIQDVRYYALTHETLTVSKLLGPGVQAFVPLVLCIVLFFISIAFFKSRSKYFAEEV